MIRRFLVGWPLNIGWLVAPAALIIAADVAQSWSSINASYGEWPATSAAWREHLVIVGPLLCAASCLYSGRIAQGRPSLLNRHNPHGRARWSRLAHHTATMAIWGCAAHSIGMLPETLHTLVTATSGSLNGLVLMHALLATATYALAGIAVGLLASTPAWCVPALVMSLIWGLLPTFSARWFGALGPVQGWQMTGWDTPNMAVLAYSSIFCLSVAVVLTVLCTTRTTPPQHLAGRIAVPLATSLALGVVAAQWRPQLALQDRSPQQCRTMNVTDLGATVDVCLHPSHTDSRPRVEAAVRAITAAAGVQLFHSVHETRSGIVGQGVAHVNVRPTSTSHDLIDSLAISSTFDPLQACSSGDAFAVTLTPAAAKEVDVRNAIADILTQLASGEPLTKPAGLPAGTPQARLWSMQVPQLRAYLQGQATNLQSCGHLVLP